MSAQASAWSCSASASPAPHIQPRISRKMQRVGVAHGLALPSHADAGSGRCAAVALAHARIDEPGPLAARRGPTRPDAFSCLKRQVRRVSDVRRTSGRVGFYTWLTLLQHVRLPPATSFRQRDSAVEVSMPTRSHVRLRAARVGVDKCLSRLFPLVVSTGPPACLLPTPPHVRHSPTRAFCNGSKTRR